MIPLLTFGLPGDAAAWGALALAFAGWTAWRRLKAHALRQPKVTAVALAACAAGFSLAYVYVYLGGGPRIIDATSYFLEARTLAQGTFSFEPLAPSGSFRGRFLTGPLEEPRLSVIFPPGYPLVLSLGFLIGRPMWVGPALAFGLVIATYFLARRLFEDERVALGAAALSLLCAALRYHTADTMAHGWSALLLTFALLALTYPGWRWTLAAGLAAGWLIATRPVTGALGLLLAFYWLGVSRRSLVFAAALLPGIGLLAYHQHAATGEWFSSAQMHYYALADGPPGCFKYGFGASVGCVHEHGDFVRAYLADGFGIWQALITSSHRLSWHTLDLANFEVLWLVLPYAVFRGYQRPPVRLLALGSVGIMLVYAPFYFNGSYPGGGARFYADVLPLEHVLVAWGLGQLGAFRLALPLALVGFAVHASHAHRALAMRDGGVPMFSRTALAEHGVKKGLVLVNTDHGFNLGFDPKALDASRQTVVARYRGDSHDRVLWEHLGRPPVYRYEFAPWSASPGPHIVPLDLTLDRALSFEAEAEWPPLNVSGGHAVPVHTAAHCASQGRVLELVPSARGTLRVALEAYTLFAARHRVELGWVRADEDEVAFTATISTESHSQSLSFSKQSCRVAHLGEWHMPAGRQSLVVSVKGARARLDFVRLTLTPSEATHKERAGTVRQ